MRRILSLLLVLCLFVGMFSAVNVSAIEVDASGEIEYTFADGILTLTGNGEMADYFFEEAPWFKYATDTKKVVIESGITSIGDTAFCDFTALEEIEIADTVTSIGINSFSGCGLFEIYLPKSIKEIDEMPFVNCDRMEKYIVDPENPYFCNSEDGVLFSKDKSVLIAYPLSTDATEYTVPDEVVEIRGYAFSRVPMLEKVVMGKNVKSMGDECFFNCPNLTTVEFNDVLEYIGGGAFQHCHGINEFKLPSTISKIRPLAFWDTGFYNQRSNWENDLLYIGEYLITGEYYPASDECEDDVKKFATGDIVIKEGTVLVASDAFSWFGYDPEIYSVSFPSTMRYINEYAFYGLNHITKVKLDGCIEWIDDGAFYSCDNLADVILGDNIKKIGVDAFAETAYINNKNNYVDGLLYNGKYLLGYKDSLPSEIEIKEGTTLIAAEALAGGGTYYVHNVTLPESLEIICEYAFLGTNTGAFEIPATVTYIGDYAIGYRKITTSYTEEYVLMEGSSIKGDPKTEAERYAQEFQLEFKNSVTAEQITFGCFTANIVGGELVIVDFEWDDSYSPEVDIPAAHYGYTITGIESGAFKDCSGLTSISMFEYVTYIGENAFVNCENVKFYFPCGTVAHKYAEANGLNYEAECIFPEDNDVDGIENVCPGCERTQCEVQGHIINGVPGENYSYCMRDGCDYLSTYYGDGYWENGFLYAVTDENKAILVDADASITGCVEIPETLGGYPVVEISGTAFYDCSGITGFVIPNCVEYPGDFQGCSDFTIYCECGSYTHKYLKRYGGKYELTGGCSWLDATCTAPQTCENCGNTQGEALGHTPVIDEAVPPTCTETGLTEGSHCSVCNEILVYQYTDYSKGHTYTEEVTKAPTCSTVGTVVYTCEVCEYSYDKMLPPSAHTTKLVSQKATYFAVGYKDRVICKNCGEVTYEGTKVKMLKLKTPKVTVKAGKKKFTVKYTKVKDAKGFEVKYTKGKKTVTKTYSTKKNATKTINKLAKGNYKVQVRAFIKQGKKVAYSNWTKATTAKVK